MFSKGLFIFLLLPLLFIAQTLSYQKCSSGVQYAKSKCVDGINGAKSACERELRKIDPTNKIINFSKDTSNKVVGFGKDAKGKIVDFGKSIGDGIKGFFGKKRKKRGAMIEQEKAAIASAKQLIGRVESRKQQKIRMNPSNQETFLTKISLDKPSTNGNNNLVESTHFPKLNLKNISHQSLIHKTSLTRQLQSTTRNLRTPLEPTSSLTLSVQSTSSLKTPLKLAIHSIQR